MCSIKGLGLLTFTVIQKKVLIYDNFLIKNYYNVHMLKTHEDSLLKIFFLGWNTT